MNKTAIIFPGQASQYVGMGKDLYEASAEVKALYQFASDEIGEDMAKLSFEGPADRLKETRFTQPAILIHSLAILKTASEIFLRQISCSFTDSSTCSKFFKTHESSCLNIL